MLSRKMPDQPAQPSEPELCRRCMARTAEGDWIPNLDGFIWFCRGCVKERTRSLKARADAILSG